MNVKRLKRDHVQQKATVSTLLDLMCAPVPQGTILLLRKDILKEHALVGLEF